MAGARLQTCLYLLLNFAIVLRTSVAQDTCGASDHFALFVHDDSDDTNDGIYKATADFDAGGDFSKLPLETTENPTAVFKDVVEDLVYWAGNDLTIGRYIKRDTKAGGTTQDKSLITCSGTALGIEDETIMGNQLYSEDEMTVDAASNAVEAGPQRARLDLAADLDQSPPELGAWIAADGTDPSISVNLLGRPTITGVILQGRADAPMWTKTYEVHYSQDYITWEDVKDATGETATFTGNSDQNSKVTQTFVDPVVALYIRIVPKTWYYDSADSDDTTIDAPALRFELLGCKVPQCSSQALGVEDGTILDSQLTGSSGTASDGRLNAVGKFWAAAGGVPDEYVDVFLGGRAIVTAVQVQGGGNSDWVTMFEVEYSQDGTTWIKVKDSSGVDMEFTGATGTTNLATATFNRPVSATHIRIRPTATDDGDIEMRFEVRGCREPEITRIAVDGTCESRKVYWIERGGGVIYYADLEAESPTAQELVTGVNDVVDIELDIENDLIYLAQQDGTTSYIKTARLSDGALQNTVTVSSTNGNIQSIAIDWGDTERVYYSINANADDDGSIGYVDLALSGNTVVYTPDNNPAGSFYPYDIGVYDNHVYALEDKDSIIRVLKTPPGLATDNTPENYVTSGDADFRRLAADFQFVECIDYPSVSFEKDAYSPYETEGVLDVKLTRKGDLRCCSTVDMTIGEDNPPNLLAKDPEDFDLLDSTAVDGTPPTITFKAGIDSIRLQFRIVQDNNIEDLIGEGDEQFRLTLDNNACSTLGEFPSSEVTVRDYYSCYYLDPEGDSYEVTEGETNQVESLPIFRKGYLEQPGAINIVFISDSAKIFEDFQYPSASTSASASFGTSSGTSSVSVTIIGDADLEYPERFGIQLNVPFGAENTLLCPEKPQKSYVNITDNDFRLFLEETHITTSEDSVTVDVPICRKGYLKDGGVNVQVNTYDVSARAGSDYIGRNGYQVTFQENADCVDAEISLIDDSEGEPNEAFRVVISNPSKGQLNDSKTQTFIGITDDDLAIRFEHDQYTVNEASDLFVTLLREGDIASDQDVYLVAISGSAISGDDFVDPGQVDFEAGEDSKRVSIDIIDDLLDDDSETFTLRLMNGAGQIFSTAIVTIEDNDETPTITEQRYFFDRSSLSIDEDIGNLQVAVVRTRTESAGSVKVTTTSGTATSGLDFTGLTSLDPASEADFAVGDSRATINIHINDDDQDEGDESFTAQLSEPSDGIVSSNSNILITILDDDDEDDDDDGDGGDDGDGDDTINISTEALIGIILGAAVLILTLLALAVCGCCLLLRPMSQPPPYSPPVAPQPVGYGYGPSYGPQSYNGYYGQNKRALGPV